MNKNNNGYTLTELLISIAILGVVMLGIAGVMRSVTGSYAKGTFEVQVQEESQIVVNQINDLLCDATALTSASASGKYTFKDKDNKTISIIYDINNNLLNLEYKDGSGNTCTDLLCDNVSNFQIDGFLSGNDNSSTIKLTLDNNGYSYEAVREVNYRNNVENSTFNDIANLTTVTTTADPDAYLDTIPMLRYDTVNLTALYGITSIPYKTKPDGSFELDSNGKKIPACFNDKADDYFELVDPVNDTYSKNSGDQVIIIKPNATVTGTLSDSVPKSDGCVFTGYKSGSSTPVQILLYVDAVEVETEGVYYLDHINSVTANNGYHTTLNVKGINIKEYINAGKSISYDFYLLNGTTEEGKKEGCSVSKITKLSNGGNRISKDDAFAADLCMDPYSTGFVIASGNDSKGSPEGPNKKLKYVIHFGTDTADYGFTIPFNRMGQNVNKDNK